MWDQRCSTKAGVSLPGMSLMTAGIEFCEYLYILNVVEYHKIGFSFPQQINWGYASPGHIGQAKRLKS